MFRLGERIGLRAFAKEEIEQYLRWFNDPEIYQYILRIKPLGRAEEEEFLASQHKREGDVIFIIALREGGQAIGSCGLHKISLSNRSAELGIVIGEKEYHGRGFGREAMELLCEYGFNVLNLHRIGLEVYEYNARGIRCYEHVGFRLEGSHREARFWNGRYWNIQQYGLLAAEWREARSSREAAHALCQTR